ncbi:uncharacterized protein LOC134539545 isoform X2 [Bacillus rossius redtenbacheri]|uniref:uncharacterized protein LOC134539545 isoform X2 n=1 Tax=Bacillus rossius redtenbacheri TaxID=93214 RepID=UPI002FDD1EDA
METGYWNFPDGEHFSTSNSLYGQSLMEDTKHSLLDMDILSDSFIPYENVQQFERSEPDLWDTETELNGDIAVLPRAMSKHEGHSKEDFHKVLSDWQEHVGSMQASDTEDMDVKDIVGLDIAMPRNFSEHLSEGIFDEETSLDSEVKTWQPSSKSNSSGQAFLTTIVKEEYNFDLDNFLDCDDDGGDDDDDVSLKVVEEDVQDSLSRGDSHLEFQEESEGIFGNIELPMIQSAKIVTSVSNSPKRLFPEYSFEKINHFKMAGINNEMNTIIIKDELDILDFEENKILLDEEPIDSIMNDSEVENNEHELFQNSVQVVHDAFQMLPNSVQGQPNSVQVQPDPVKMQPDPVKMQPDPVKVQHSPVKVQTNLVQVQHSPIKVQPNLVQVQHSPVKVPSIPVTVQPNHVKVQHNPVKLQPNPVKVQPNPVKVQPNPVKVQPNPIKVQPNPVKVQPNPVKVQPNPVKVHLHPIIKSEENEDCIDVETVSEQMPVLEAGDLKSLLEQFEASEAVNGSGPPEKQSVLDSHLFAMATQQPPAPAGSSPLSGSSKLAAPSLSHQNIKDALPKEVIDRIKASGRKKVIPVIPAMPSKKTGRAATRMQDAGAALSRNKLLKIVSGNAGGESVQLDHDYCCSSGENSPTKSFYHSDASEYCGKSAENLFNKSDTHKDSVYSRLPDYIVMAPQAKNNKKPPSKDEECWEKNAKKDSGLESGDVSDASEETLTPPGSVFTPVHSFPELNETWKKTRSPKQAGSSDVSNVLSVNGKDIDLEAVGVNVSSLSKKSNNCKAVQNQPKPREITMVSVLKKCQAPVVAPRTAPCTDVREDTENVASSNAETKEEARETKKRKINLEQYRSRLKELDKARPGDGGVSDPPCVDSVEPASVGACAPASVVVDGDANCASDRTGGEVKEQETRPSVCSVEIQTQLNYSSGVPSAENKEEKTESGGGRSRDRRHKQYRSRRASSSSSCASSSSSSSRRSRSSRRRVDTHSRRRRRRSKHNSSGSASGNRHHRFWSRSRSSSHSSSCSRSRSPIHNTCRNNVGDWPLSEREKLRQVEERRVVYVGRIDEGTTKADLRRRFEVFGNIVDISVHFREHGDNYGFVTFQYKDDAYNAVEHGNDDPNSQKFDLCFGGRRAFCKTRYADLDGIATHDEDLAVAQNAWKVRRRPIHTSHNKNSFDLLLREAQAKLQKRNV